jgi:biopolymer transport protein ExbB/TolQ
MRVFLAISDTLLYPVLISLILLVAYTFFSIGKVLSEYASRREGRVLFNLPSNYRWYLEEGKASDELIDIFRQNQQSLSGEAEILKDGKGNWRIVDGLAKFQIRNTGKQAGVYIDRSSQVEHNMRDMENGEDVSHNLPSERLAVFYNELGRIVNNRNSDIDSSLIAARVQRLLEEQEREATKALERTRVLIRVGPMLGLMGTLIPLGPALVALSGGDMSELSSNLIIAFSSTVVGLLIGAVAMVVNSIGRRWYRQDLSDMEYTAENLVASLERGREAGGSFYRTERHLSDLSPGKQAS